METCFKITPENNEHWLKLRKEGIGGSQVAAILGHDEYRTPLDVYYDIKGLSDNDFTDIQLGYMERGLRMEIPLLEWYNKQEGVTHKFIHNATNDIYISKSNPIFRCTPDGLNGSAVAEVKDTRAVVMVPVMKWFIQGMWNLGVTGKEELVIIWDDGRKITDYKVYSRNEEVINYMQQQIIEFWNNNIVADVPPLPVNVNDVLKLYPEQVTGKSVELDVTDFEIIERIQELSSNRKILEKEEEELKNNLKMKMQDSECLVYGENIVATWKADKCGKMDTTKFKKEYPDLFKQYEGKPARRFLLKGA